MNISIVIPVLNEAKLVGAQLDAVDALGPFEVIVVDGGSEDGTVDIVRRHPSATLIEGPRGRGRQLNAGARHATGDTIVFLHVDVRLPSDALPLIRQTLEDPKTIGGAFKTWTVPDDGPHRLGPLLHIADIRSRYTRHPYGDQCIFVRRHVFEEVGGYPPVALMEEVELCRRLRRRGRLARVPRRVRVSGRRFEHQPIRSFVLMNLFPTLYRLGVSPSTLHRWYTDPR